MRGFHPNDILGLPPKPTKPVFLTEPQVRNSSTLISKSLKKFDQLNTDKICLDMFIPI